jgi:general secretion pathway protein J
MTRANHSASEAGFTLVELLVSLALLAVLSLALVNGLHLGTQIWRRTEETIVHENRVRAAKSEIGRLIEQSYPEYVVQRSGAAAVAFYGATDRLTFLAPDENLPGSLDYVEIASSNGTLVVSRSPELAPQAATQTHIVLSGVKGLAVFYYGIADSRSQPQWSRQWIARDRPPVLVQLHIDTGGPEPVELTATPRAEADMSCSYSALTQYCEGRP